jgi:hypothetical protein
MICSYRNAVNRNFWVTQKYFILILRSAPEECVSKDGHKRLLPSFETPRKGAAPQDEVE